MNRSTFFRVVNKLDKPAPSSVVGSMRLPTEEEARAIEAKEKLAKALTPPASSAQSVQAVVPPKPASQEVAPYRNTDTSKSSAGLA